MPSDTTRDTAAKFGPLPLWPWVVAWVIVIGSGLTAVGLSVYATVRILNG